jgi:Ni,Fe-hydrogenase I large subunit
MKTITVEELAKKLYDEKGTTFATILAFTKPNFVGGQKCPMIQRGVKKLAVVNVMIGNWSYENAVNNQREREHADENETVEHFTAQSRSWGEQLATEVGKRIGLIQHTKDGEVKTYLKTKIQKSLRHSYYDNNGQHVNREEAEQHIRRNKPSVRQGVEKEVFERDYELKNIRAIRMHGEVYVIA